ncbi:MAG: type II CAAX prenyl endopeptidase Rce1 family protein [Dehalococcoidia bacterium]
MLWPFLLAFILVAYNTLLPLLAGRFQERAYVPLNGAVGLLLVLVARWGLGLPWEGMGLGGRGVWAGAGWGALVGLALGLPLLAGAFLFPHLPGPARGFAPPSAPTTLGALAYHLLLRIPVGTALFEEVAFRGVLYGLLAQRWGAPPALLVSAAAFALWHCGPILVRVQTHQVHGFWPLAWQWVGGLGGTFLGGLLLGGLRWGTGGLGGPVVAHTLLNDLGLLAWYALRR